MPSPLRGGGGVDIPKDVASRLLRIDYGRDATGNRLRAPASRSPNNLRVPSMRMRQEYFVESSASIDNFVSAEEFPELAHLIKVRASLPPTNPLPSPSPLLGAHVPCVVARDRYVRHREESSSSSSSSLLFSSPLFFAQKKKPKTSKSHQLPNSSYDVIILVSLHSRTSAR